MLHSAACLHALPTLTRAALSRLPRATAVAVALGPVTAPPGVTLVCTCTGGRRPGQGGEGLRAVGGVRKAGREAWGMMQRKGALV